MRPSIGGKKLLEENLSQIDRILESLSRRRGAPPEEAEDFAAWVRLKLIEKNYRLVRQFRGESRFTTYVTVVISRLWVDYSNRRWGKWRPSACARRLGTAATALERLMVRDGLTFDEASRVLEPELATIGCQADLEVLAAQLPTRVKRRMVGEEALAGLGTDSEAERRLLEKHQHRAAERVSRLLSRELRRLPLEDRRILKLRFVDARTIPQIAAELGLKPKPLYRRIDKSLAVLRQALESSGVTGTEARLSFATGVDVWWQEA